jgi:ferric-chelate reductase (NADPH)
MSKLKSAVLSLVGPKLLSKAKIFSNEAVGPGFRMITLESDSLHHSTWAAGGKVQINTGEWVMRTYTPLSIDSAKGQMTLLAFVSGAGPGSRWAKSARGGDTTNFKGPDGKIKLPTEGERLVIFGDETSFGLAAGIKRTLGADTVIDFIFEVSSEEISKAALVELRLTNAQLFPKNTGVSVHANLSATLLKLFSKQSGMQCVLSGRAQSIQALRKSLQNAGVQGGQLMTKVYWSEGKVGLD